MDYLKVPSSELFVSEPNPLWFGNPKNEVNGNWTNGNWLKSRFHFSFAEYRDPLNSKFGVLKVMNDDLVQPLRGFGEHPHQDMEIVTYVVNGDLTHEDSTGNRESLGKGSVQFMTAGVGLYHSERNDNEKEPCRFIQMWILPRTRGLPVNYGSLRGDSSLRDNKWQHLVSDVKSAFSTPIKINQDANIYVAEISGGQSLSLGVGKNRMVYLLMIEGKGHRGVEVRIMPAISTGGDSKQKEAQCITDTLLTHDASKIYGPKEVSVSPSLDGKAHVLVVEMAKQV